MPFPPELFFLEEDGDPFDPDNDWLEITDLESPSSFMLTERTSEVTIHGWVEPDRLRACIVYLMGYGWVDDDLNLRRELPAWCPYPGAAMLYCSGITNIVGVGPDGKEGPLYAGGLSRSKWTCYKVSFRCSTTPWKVRSDSAVVTDGGGYKKEWERFTTRVPQPRTEWLEVPGGSILYDGAPGDADGKPIQAANWRIREQKQDILLTWYVPWDFVFDENDFSPKLSYMDGTVNDHEFMGRPAQTLLCDGIKVEKYNQVVASDVFQFEMYLAVIAFTLKYFNPPRGNTGNSDRGWQLAPYAPDHGRFYPVKRPLGAAGDVEKNYPEWDFRKAFTHYSLDVPSVP